MIARARTILFLIVFYTLSVAIVVAAPVPALIGQRQMIGYARIWARLHRWTTRWILGIRTRVEGMSPPPPVLYAAKHQAMFETIEFALMLDAPALVMKAELAHIPIWGWAARRYGIIVIDRGSSGAGLRRMMREAQATIAAGRSVVIFPEGTRVVPGARPPLRSGFAGLYRALGVDVVPIALDSGRLLPRKGVKRAGVVRFRFGTPIPPGLSRAEIEQRVHTAINILD
ncbi:lysophospholipid acyltransferase family protein [Hephaestia sp. GCM10023244]|uniref:lysophospholipid acyltransferase family protein n=1 Tax=unclassified Hephaestia TaxID=2631281 RepID=UPI0020778E63|nr:lysophospholipid acyltransferase family protein [Hephaestia sp. MAHUQ-44]MCM8731181.1 1-acyl-sn-glycerol-3-phosphate acyltransferase [Hephaestia sp. MAHUQ-44]